jgi:aminopeptidase N
MKRTAGLLLFIPFLIAGSSGLGDKNIMAGKIDVLNYSIQLKIEDAGNSISGSGEIEFRVLTDIRELLFNFKKMEISASALDGEPIRCGYDGDQISINAPEILKSGSVHKVRIDYSGRPKDGLIIRPNKYNRFGAFSDNWANRARCWFPSVDHPSDKATVSFQITVPAKYKVIANGSFTGSLTSTGGNTVYKFRMDVPVPTYCMVIGVSDFSVDSTKSYSGIPIYYYTYREDSLNASKGFLHVPGMVEYFEKTIGPYPYTKLALVESSTVYGGMENSSAIFLPEMGASYTGRYNNEETVVHEIAHQWFGDDLTESDWSDLWLSEGFATYFSFLYFEDRDGEAAFHELIKNAKESYLKESPKTEPVVNENYKRLTDLLNSENYTKGALFLDALRNYIGNRAFFRGIKEYYNKFKHSNVTTTEFMNVMNGVSGKDLDSLFQRWLYAPGLPD